MVKQLETNGIQVVGKYQPANDKNRYVVVITSPELISAVKKTGGLTGFAGTLRIGLTSENGKTVVSYTNPLYWGNAYFRDDFDKVFILYATLKAHLEMAMKASGNFDGSAFGSEKGLSEKDLRKYHYMMAMPYFNDVVELGKFGSYTDAVEKIEANLKKGVPGVAMVSAANFPGMELTLYNLALTAPEGESKFMPTIDIGHPQHTAFLPYEILVSGNQVVMLHGRYRIALSFPDLTMGTFTKIMSTPGYIEDQFKQVVQ